MNHDYMNITYTDKDYISHLVPESLLEELKLPGQYAMAQGITTESGENEIIGAATFFVDTNPNNEITLNVRWFYIQPEYRGNGHGRELYNRVCELAVENNVKTIRISFPDIEETQGLSYVFYEMDYDYTKNGSVKMFTSLGEIMNQHTIHGKLKANNAAIPLSDITDSMLRKYVDSLEYVRRHESDYILPVKVEDYEKDVSFVVLDANKDIIAALLLRHINDALEPVVFQAKDEDNVIPLFEVLGNCISACDKKFGKDKSVRLRTNAITKWDKIGRLLPELKHIPVIQGTMDLV